MTPFSKFKFYSIELKMVLVKFSFSIKFSFLSLNIKFHLKFKTLKKGEEKKVCKLPHLILFIFTIWWWCKQTDCKNYLLFILLFFYRNKTKWSLSLHFKCHHMHLKEVKEEKFSPSPLPSPSITPSSKIDISFMYENIIWVGFLAFSWYFKWDKRSISIHENVIK